MQMPSVIQRLPAVKKEPPILTVQHPSKLDVELSRAAAFIQKVLRGRATQSAVSCS